MTYTNIKQIALFSCFALLTGVAAYTPAQAADSFAGSTRMGGPQAAAMGLNLCAEYFAPDASKIRNTFMKYNKAGEIEFSNQRCGAGPYVGRCISRSKDDEGMEFTAVTYIPQSPFIDANTAQSICSTAASTPGVQVLGMRFEKM